MSGGAMAGGALPGLRGPTSPPNSLVGGIIPSPHAHLNHHLSPHGPLGMGPGGPLGMGAGPLSQAQMAQMAHAMRNYPGLTHYEEDEDLSDEEIDCDS